MAWLLLSITVERSGLPSSGLRSKFVMLILKDVTGFSGGAFRLYFFAYLFFLAMLQVTKGEG